MSGIPAWVPMLDLNNDLELGPNCPDDVRCVDCPVYKDDGCQYADVSVGDEDDCPPWGWKCKKCGHISGHNEDYCSPCEAAGGY